MFALDAVSRTLLAASAFAAFGAAFVTTPIVARGDAALVVKPLPALAPLAPRTAVADVLPRRDPFAGGDTPVRRNTGASQAPGAMPISPLPQIPAALRALPPNAGAGDGTFPFATSTRTNAVVTAVITGPHPFALVDEVGTTHVLTIGDRIDGDPITAIGVDGVRLSGGTLLAVARASDAVVPSPVPARATPPSLAPPPHARPTPGGR